LLTGHVPPAALPAMPRDPCPDAPGTLHQVMVREIERRALGA
jgi:hypothetical protein